MTELQFAYHIGFDFPRRPESAAVVAERFLKTLDSLSRIDALFADWEVSDPHGRASRPLAEARPQIPVIVARNVVRDDYGPSPQDGYHASASVGEIHDPKSVNFRVRAGGKSENCGNLEFASWRVRPDPAVVIYPRYRAALLAINAQWQSVWACAYAFSMDYDKSPLFPGAPLFPYSRYHIPWLAYLSAQLASGFQLPPEIGTERTADGGLLMTATEERLVTPPIPSICAVRAFSPR